MLRVKLSNEKQFTFMATGLVSFLGCALGIIITLTFDVVLRLSGSDVAITPTLWEFIAGFFILWGILSWVYWR